MYYTISDFANIYGGGVRLVAGGGGMSRPITNVGILDYELDPSLKERYLRTNFQEGQFILSSLLFAKESPQLVAEAVKHLVSRGASGLAVRNVFRLPLPAGSCDGLMSLFAPFAREEFLRVLKPGGWMWEVIPGARHLWQLKEAVYDRPYPNAVKDYPVEGFGFMGSRPVAGKIALRGEEIAALFQMTPYYYKTSAEG